MSSEVPVTPEPPAAEPSPEVTAPPEPAKAEEPKAPEPDYRAAYVGLQRSQNKLYKRVEDVLSQNAVLADAVQVLKKGQTAVLRHTLGNEQAAALEAQDAQARERAASMRAANDARNYMISQTEVMIEALQAAGVDPRSIDWAKDAADVDDWKQRVKPAVVSAIQSANESRIRKFEQDLRQKTSKEIKEEAEVLTQRQLKEQGVDRIDTAKGGGSSSFVDRIRNASPEEMQNLMKQARAGKLKI